MVVTLDKIVSIALLAYVFVVTVSHGKTLRKRSEHRVMEYGNGEFGLLGRQSSIEEFANNDLCRHLRGQQYLQTAMKTKLPDLNESMLSIFVSQLCAEKGVILEMWVAQLFDTDGDGNLNHFEMNYYKSNK